MPRMFAVTMITEVTFCGGGNHASCMRRRREALISG